MNEKQIKHMLEMQEELNAQINPNWREARYPWWRAAYTEAVEAINHLGWEWWKNSEPNMQQVHLEIVDIWHFALSQFLQNNKSGPQALLDWWEVARVSLSEPEDTLIDRLESFVAETVCRENIHFTDLFRVTMLTGLEFDHLYALYIGKNVLNTFRQDHGYKNGTYTKQWGDKEDNEVLYGITIDLLHCDKSNELHNIEQTIYEHLKNRYDKVLAP